MPAYKDKNNKWYVSFRYQDWTGKKVRKVKRGFETRREALEWERRFLLKENGSMDMRFGNFVEIYKEDLKERLKRSTWIMKISVIDQKILPYFKDKKINEIKASDVIAWQKEIMGYRDDNGEAFKPTYLKPFIISSARFLITQYGITSCPATLPPKQGIWEKKKQRKCCFGQRKNIWRLLKKLWTSPFLITHLKCCTGAVCEWGNCLRLRPRTLILQKGLCALQNPINAWRGRI